MKQVVAAVLLGAALSLAMTGQGASAKVVKKARAEVTRKAKIEAINPQQALSSCVMCHDITKARKQKFGPPLYGIYNGKQPKASLAAKYPRITPAFLNKFLANPKAVDPSSRMPIRVTDAKKRAQIIAALRELK